MRGRGVRSVGRCVAPFLMAERKLIRRRFLRAMGVIAIGFPLGACKIVATPKKNAASGDDSGAPGFDPQKMVAAIWDSKVIPYLTRKAGKFSDVVALAQTNPAEAG